MCTFNYHSITAFEKAAAIDPEVQHEPGRQQNRIELGTQHAFCFRIANEGESLALRLRVTRREKGKTCDQKRRHHESENRAQSTQPGIQRRLLHISGSSLEHVDVRENLFLTP